ncbi:MAG: type II toxin-antitoxin system RelE/ParE family toxin [Acidobacteria bacterium]|nr:type II toxin-antitoxin system RelE/ParE family toxin [Acidobacteriota bacterium]
MVNCIFPKIAMLAKEPRPPKCLKLTGEEDLWRIGVGDYRVLYTINDPQKLVDVIAVRHRREAYQ